MNVRNDNEPFSFHPAGIQVLYADGRVEFLSQSLDLKVMAALSTRAAGD
jgi:prepilin-type processing-associated H-X9-DG protein